MVDGAIEQADGAVTFRYERELHHPIGTVWNAITDPVNIEGWSGGRVEIELKRGAYISYHGEAVPMQLNYGVPAGPPRASPDG